MDLYENVFKLTSPSISNKINLWAKKAGVDLTPHSFRHFYAEQLFRSSKDLQAVQVQLGHASIGTTERYLGIQQQQIQQAVDKLELENRATPPGEPKKQRQWTSEGLGLGERDPELTELNTPVWMKEIQKRMDNGETITLPRRVLKK